MRDELTKRHPEIIFEEFPFYSLRIFNECENSDKLLLSIKKWKHTHPLLKILPVEWDYSMPFGLLHSKEPSKAVQALLDTIGQIL